MGIVGGLVARAAGGSVQAVGAGEHAIHRAGPREDAGAFYRIVSGR